MAAVKEFTLPDLGEGLTEAEIVRWLVEVGEVVAVDQPVVEVETAKAVVEVPCPYGGVVTACFGEPGDSLAVGRPLVTVAVGSGTGPAGHPGDRTGHPGDAHGTHGTHSTHDAEDTEDTVGEGSGNVLVGYGTAAGPGRRRGRARAAPLNSVGAPGGGRTAPSPPGTAGEGTAGDKEAADTEAAGETAQTPPAPLNRADAGPVAVISPLVRRLARDNGLDLRELAGTGPEGLILRADVERAAADAAVRDRPPAPETPVPVRAGERAPSAPERVPLRGIRGAVADKLSRSRREIPDATCWVDADATELLAVRAAMNTAAASAPSRPPGHPSGGAGAGTGRISVLALLARITTAALVRHPELNATVDTERGEIVRLSAVHLGFAAQTARGLVVPVVRDAHARTTAELSAEIARLTEKSRINSLKPGELTGGTFTLNNYGVFGVDGSTPIINHPEAAMLGVGRIAPKPWVHEGELAVRQVVQLSFTFDHRVCDGGTAGGFLRFVADCVENPALLLAAV